MCTAFREGPLYRFAVAGFPKTNLSAMHRTREILSTKQKLLNCLPGNPESADNHSTGILPAHSGLYTMGR
jgi:hypothetical protein